MKLNSKQKNIFAVIGLIILIIFISRANLNNLNSLNTQQTFAIQTGLNNNLGSYQPPASATQTLSYNSLDFCSAFTLNYPSYPMVNKMLCSSAGGTYLCEKNKIGCYYISSWDSSACNSNQIKQLGQMCEGVDGKWTCNLNSISCDK